MGAEMNTTYHSDFGGLWTDRTDAASEIDARYSRGDITMDQHYLLRNWIANGYVILEGAVDRNLCDELADELKTIFLNGSDTVLYQRPLSGSGDAQTVPKGLQPQQMRLVDMYGSSRLAARVLMSPVIVDFLSLIFESAPLCFQGLTFEQGSGQGLHQDTAYVVVDKPLELAASWIALEDIREGSGELMYVEGSHRLPEWKFGGASKHWNAAEHGSEDHDEWARYLIRKSEEMGLQKKTFRPSKGDVLIWSADLVHGGSPIGDPSLTRRSIVGHYCPVDRTPHYFAHRPNRTKVAFEGGYFSSYYYDPPLAAEASTRRTRWWHRRN